MSASNDNAKTIFLQAIELEGDARDAFVRSQCGGDEILLADVKRLLYHHSETGSFLDSVPTGMAGRTFDIAKSYAEGESIGPYKILQKIGEGGMGVVYMAEQKQPVKRRVALKIIKPGMDSKQVLARFEAERQALAMMDRNRSRLSALDV